MVAVHPSLPIPGLTIEQLQQIYTGTITNWNQVSGPNQLITIFVRPVSAGHSCNIITRILGDMTISNNARFISRSTSALSELANTPGGIYVTAASTAVRQCSVKVLPVEQTSRQFVSPYREPSVSAEQCSPQNHNQPNQAAFQAGQYPEELMAELYVVVKQDNSAARQAGEAYKNLLLTEQGQALIEESGLVRIR